MVRSSSTSLFSGLRLLAAACLASASAGSAQAAFVQFQVNTTVVGGLIKYEVFGKFNGATDTVLNAFHFNKTVNGGSPVFHHADAISGGVDSTVAGTWNPQFVLAPGTAMDSYVCIGGGEGFASGNTTNPDPGFGAGGFAQAQIPFLSAGTTTDGPGWFNPGLQNLQGRVNAQGLVKLGQFVLGATDAPVTLFLKVGYNNGTAGAPVQFAEGLFLLGTSPCQVDDDADGISNCTDTTFNKSLAGGTIPNNSTTGLSKTFTISNGWATAGLSDVRVTLTGLSHTWVGDLEMTLIPPSGTAGTVFSRIGKTSATTGTGDASDFGSTQTYVFGDGFTGNIWNAAATAGTTTVIPGANYFHSAPLTGTAVVLSSAFTAAQIPGTWTVRIADLGTGETVGGSVSNIAVELVKTADLDGDGRADTADNCPSVSNPAQADADGDGDGDACDNCPSIANASQANGDTDTFGDACDNCPAIANQSQVDGDSDLIGNACDNCPDIANASQANGDTDTFGDACDNCPVIANQSQADCDSDGAGDACEIAAATEFDCDSDGVPDTCEGAVHVASASPLLAPFGSTQPQSHTFTGLPRAYRGTPKLVVEAIADLNLSSEYLTISIDGGTQEFFFVETGSDCPATPDIAERTFALADFNAAVADGALTVNAIASGTVSSTQCANGGLRFRLIYEGLGSNADCNGNTLLDSCEIATGTAPDCNGNGRPDSCDLASGAPDCNSNGVPDSCDLAGGTSTDLNANGVPDDCEFVVGGSGYASIAAAVAAAPNGTTISVGAGSYGPIDLTGRALTIQSIAGAAQTFIDGGATARCIVMLGAGSGSTVIHGFTIRNGRGEDGGAVALTLSSPSFENCVFTGNIATGRGGAAAVRGSASRFTNCVFNLNSAAGGGALWVEGTSATGEVVLTDCTFTNNTAASIGGAIRNEAPLRVDGCVFETNTATINGGAASFLSQGSAQVIDTRFCRNAPSNVQGAFSDLGGNTLSQDCDGDGQCDADEIASGAERDCNGDGVPDACDLDGIVRGFGDNLSGQAVPPATLGEIRQIAAGCSHSAALKPDGTVVCWGLNNGNQCTVPAGLAGVTAISAGCDHTLALRGNGTVAAWGKNLFGQCNVPGTLAGVAEVAAGGTHSLARRSNGTVVAWGRNDDGESTVPAGLSSVAQLAGGGAHSIALRTDGSLVGWGLNNFGQRTIPASLGAVRQVAAGCYHTVALRTNGTVACFGSNSFGQCDVPSGLNGVARIASGIGQHSAAIRLDGSVVAWGWSAFGQTTVPSGLPASAEVAIGGSHTLLRDRGAKDCDGDGVLDTCEIATNPSADCDGDGILNNCEIAAGAADCNGNGVPDSCDLASGASTDLDGNGRLDECTGEFIVGGSGYGTIQAAINAAPNDTVIRVAPGSYGALVLTDRSLTLLSLAGAAQTTINGAGERAIDIVRQGGSPLVIDGFTITGGVASGGGGGLRITDAAPSIRNCIIRGNSTTFTRGGGARCIRSNARFTNCLFELNTAPEGGALSVEGLLADGDLVQVIDCTFRDNTAATFAGAINVMGPLTLDGSLVELNTANAAPPLPITSGAVHIFTADPVTISDTKFCRNFRTNIVGGYIDAGGNILSGDCDDDGLCDYDEIAAGTEPDCNGNGIPDPCDIAGGTSPDCNANGVPDPCDVASGASNDVDSNGVPDECKPDCDGDELPDAWELAQGLADDCDADGTPDNCEIASTPALDCNGNGALDSCDLLDGAPDCNANGRIDSCDIASGVSEDENANGKPDSCELARGDLNLDGTINAADIAVLLNFWGVVNPPTGDLTGDGVINAADITVILSNWGVQP